MTMPIAPIADAEQTLQRWRARERELLVRPSPLRVLLCEGKGAFP